MKRKSIALKGTKVEVTDTDREILDSYLRDYETFEFPKDENNYALTDEDFFDIELTLLENKYHIEVFPNEIRSVDYVGFVDGKPSGDKRSPCQTFKGTNKDSNREVRLSINENGISGFIQLEDQKLFIEKSAKFGLPNRVFSLFVVYYEKDIIDKGGGYCGVTDEQEKRFLERIMKPSNGPRSSHCHFLKIATDADFAFFQLHDEEIADTNAAILNIINLIEGVYMDTFDVFPRVTFQNVWTTNDPYTGNPITPEGAWTLVNQLRNYWQANFTGVVRDVVHLFTGVNAYIDNGVFGMVFDLGTICLAPADSYGFTRERFNAFLTTAHEIGHNFGGIHADGVNCGTPTASIMCQGDKQIPMYFSEASITRISNFINANSACLHPNLFYSIVGNYIVCISEQYTVANLSPNGTVSWTVSPSNLATLTTSGQTATLATIQNGTVNLTATINDGCSTPIVISRTLLIAGKELAMDYMTVQRNTPHGCVINGQTISFGLVIEGVYGCLLLDYHGVTAVEWEFYNHGSATPNFTQNAGHYACGSPEPSNTGVTVSFTNLPAIPFMITFRFRVRNRCGVWTEFSPGFAFQITRC